MGAIDLGVDRHGGARAHHAVDAEPAAMAAGAAGVLAQREALDEERVLHFLQLDGRVAHVAKNGIGS